MIRPIHFTVHYITIITKSTFLVPLLNYRSIFFDQAIAAFKTMRDTQKQGQLRSMFLFLPSSVRIFKLS